jgi:L-alanine-DL-glutamate epimerase-like enolase superfamily enzyme
MLRALNVAHESWALATPFRISRGVKTIADVVVMEIHETNGGTGGSGRGEAVPYARYGETVDSVLEQVRGMKSALAAGLTREALQQAMPPGAARNAIDCALWDLSATLSGRSVTAQLGHGPLPSLPAMLTIGIDTPEAMHAAAERLRDAPMIKVKLDANDPAARLRAVRAGAPQARLVVDANEGWTFDILKAMQPTLADARVELIEQPLPAKADAVLEGFDPACPICADESCHVADNLPELLGRYQAVNIKLDKTGGLTAALELLKRAREEGLLVMCGCMVSTSLAIAPAFHIARHADFVDLDGPVWLKQDRAGGLRVENGALVPPAGALWGARTESMP